MHRFFTIVFVLSLAVPCRAADESKPNTLTPEEIAEGWILLFDGKTTFGWDAAGKPAVRDSLLLLGGDEDVRVSTTTAFRRYVLKLEYLIEKTKKDAAPVTWIVSTGPKVKLYPFHVWSSAAFIVGEDHILHTFLIDGKKGMASASGSRQAHPPKMRPKLQPISLGVPKGNKVSLRNVKLTPLDMKPLFNGKDLTGWKEFPGKKSTFTVTKEGWLNIKNGPGDLQTTGEWADFVLQLDCKTNGDHLNSGVFFRCIPGQYQNGYEAQIQNQQARKLKTYTIDEYDPKTHKLADKKTIANWSQDYGTGAIYRRIPARRSVARDREWFTMTVIANGRHIATWVNGIQVVDWDDNRPEHENARNGCRLKKGPISLQGHDPTTDLLFRNIRIANCGGKD